MKTAKMTIRMALVAVFGLALVASDAKAQIDGPKPKGPVSILKLDPAPMPMPLPQTPIRLGVEGSGRPGLGFWINRSLPNTPAADMGLEQGDMILSINGNLVDTNSRMKEALDDAQANQNNHVRLIVQNVRTGGLLQIDADLMEVQVPMFYGAAPGGSAPLGNAPKTIRAKNITIKPIKR